MKSPQPSKQFRWVGTLSEEELLGIRVSARTTEVDAIPLRNAEPPPRRPPPAAPARARRLHKRDGLTVLAVGAAVWLAVGGAGHGLQFPGSARDAPEAFRSSTSIVTVDRDPISTLPRFPAANDTETRPGGGGHEQGSKTKGGEQDSSPPRSDDGSAPGKPPLAEVTVPGVGTVTVELPKAPELADTGEVLPEAPTVPLP